MSDLTVVVTFTTSSQMAPATGLALADIDMYLVEQDKNTGALTVIWDGTQNPTAEITNTGQYIRIHPGADENANNYHAGGLYTGAAAVDIDWSVGSNDAPVKFPAGPIEFTYTVTEPPEGIGAPIDGVEVWFSTDNPTGSPNDVQNVVWKGFTDAFGIAYSVLGNLPQLDAGTYFVWRQKAGIDFTNPDTEVVSNP